MTLWWIGDVILLVVLVPVVVYLLNGVLQAAQKHRPDRARDRDRRCGRVKGPSTRRHC